MPPRSRSRIGGLKRTEGRVAPFESIWLVTEGEKTEPNYLTAFRDELGLSNIFVKPQPEGLSPTNLYDFAVKVLRSSDSLKPDKIYIVFDRDEYPDYQRVIDRCEREKKIFAIPSSPCFEYWLLLHVKKTTRDFGEPSVVLRELKKHAPFATYSKGRNDIYPQIRHCIDKAAKNAVSCRREMKNVGANCPLTLMDKIVALFREQRKLKDKLSGSGSTRP